MSETLRTVKYSVADATKFEKVALKLGRSKRLVFSQMIDYFYRSKKDPADFNDELLRNTILKGQKDYIGFIKTQESELLVPIKRDVLRTLELEKKIDEAINGTVINQNELVLKHQQYQNTRIVAISDILKNIDEKAETKAKLKTRFLSILNTYIKSREAFGMMTSTKEKDELAAVTREQINLL